MKDIDYMEIRKSQTLKFAGSLMGFCSAGISISPWTSIVQVEFRSKSNIKFEKANKEQLLRPITFAVLRENGSAHVQRCLFIEKVSFVEYQN